MYIIITTTTIIVIIIIIIISGFTDLTGTLTASHPRFRYLFRQSVGLLWTSDQPVARASTYTGQHNTETRGQTSMP
jgi:hypothetical protein